MGRSRPAARRRPSASRWLVVAFGLLLAVSLGLRYGPRWRHGADAALSRVRDVLPGGGDATSAPGGAPQPAAAAAPNEAPLRLQILNATGVNRLALERGEGLREWGVDALDRDNAPDYPFPETLLLVRSSSPERLDAVRDLARRLGGVPVILQRRDDLMLDATLVLGQDWSDYRWPEP
ncbi:LytR C-terminal domain-containing protein [bacterium]|nr:LytR C-terminal domain-containing protein [bacterium]